MPYIYCIKENKGTNFSQIHLHIFQGFALICATFVQLEIDRASAFEFQFVIQVPS